MTCLSYATIAIIVIVSVDIGFVLGCAWRWAFEQGDEAQNCYLNTRHDEDLTK